MIQSRKALFSKIMWYKTARKGVIYMSENIKFKILSKEEMAEMAKKIVKPAKTHPYNVFIQMCGVINPSDSDDDPDDSDGGAGLGFDFSRPNKKKT